MVVVATLGSRAFLLTGAAIVPTYTLPMIAAGCNEHRCEVKILAATLRDSQGQVHHLHGNVN